MACRRILLAEDDPNDAELFRTALEGHGLGADLTVVGDGAEALDYLLKRGKYEGRSNGHPMVVVLDKNMPRLNGIEALQKIKEHDQLRMIPVVLLTSSQDERDIAQSYRLGVNAYVVKPTSFSEFMDSVGRLGLFWVGVNRSAPAS